MMAKRRAVLVVTVVALLGVVGTSLFSASAGHLPVVDANDTDGQLDVRRVEVSGESQPRWKVFTWSRWTTAEMFDLGFVTVSLDTFGSARSDYYILVRSLGHSLEAELFRDRITKQDYRVARLGAVGRADQTSFYVRLPLSRMRIGAQRAFYRWRVETMFTGERCRRVCFDLAPDVGAVTEPLPVATPTPTPSLTPTPTPSPSTTD